MSINQYVWYGKKDIDFTKYGFEDEVGSYVLWRCNTKRIEIRKRDLRMYFNGIISDVLVVFHNLIINNAIYYTEARKVKKHLVMISDEELETINKMRGKINEV